MFKGETSFEKRYSIYNLEFSNLNQAAGLFRKAKENGPTQLKYWPGQMVMTKLGTCMLVMQLGS